MANTIQPHFKELCLAALLMSATVKVQLVDLAQYTYSGAHQVLSDVPSGARIGAAVELTGKSVAGGVFDATDPTFAGLVSAPSIEALWIYIEGDDEDGSPLVHFFDSGTGLPIAAGAIGGTLAWDNGPNKIFKL